MGGQDSMPGRWPWQVNIRDNNGRLFGGSLITTNWVISAAHCFQETSRTYGVFVGSYKLEKPPYNTEIGILVKSVIIHPNYTSFKNGYDISLLELSNPVHFTNEILPICLPAAKVTFPTGLKCWSSGWGNIASDVPLAYPSTLQEVALPLIDAPLCNYLYHLPYTTHTAPVDIIDNMICAGYVNGGKDTCKGESGGPLVCAGDDRWYLVGVVSFGEGCGQPNRPGVYTVLNAYLDWIQSSIPLSMPEAQQAKSGKREFKHELLLCSKSALFCKCRKSEVMVLKL
ncbi:hypothetical protein GDO86_019328 [Hymenochirus boettgeri]|uniref:Peptidase S1 domain-containing protein n=1 Tax=Hymenochirus boettgeri TaxID=247094 RepID=A0A8T2IHM4_9PIPI|nr:hypothetical protein GDO86_019328 [Hymenochirus boettgeri]